MRLRSLSLHAFGAVAERTLELGAEGPVLHLVYGPNEAGKSTTLRALFALLYGVPRETSDGAVFGYSHMRVGATLADAQGRELSIVRRKGNKNTLAAADGTLLDEGVLASFLQNMPEPVFRNMFGLDHGALRQGGEQLRRGKGDLGESLFQASTGGPSVRQTLLDLQQDADKLWKPRGKQEIRLAIERYNEARARLRQANKGAEGVRTQQRALDELRVQVAELSARQRALRAELSGLTRTVHLLPLLLQRRQLQVERAALGDVALLASDAPAQRRQAQQELARCEADATKLVAVIDARQTQRAALSIPETLLALSTDRIELISQELGKHRKAARDLPRVRAELHAATREVERALGADLKIEQLAQLPLDAAAVAAAKQRAVEYSGLRGRADDARIALAAAEARIVAECEVVRALMRDPPSDFVVPAARLPHLELVSALRARIEELRAAQAQSSRSEQALLADEEGVRQSLDVMQREGAPPTEAELLAARGARDAALRTLQAALGPEQRAFEFGGGSSSTPIASASPARAEQRAVAIERARASIASLEREQARADEIADRLRREAARVSELSRLLALQERITRERAQLLALRKERQALLEEQLAEWRALWVPLGIEPKEPAAMHPWLLGVSARLDQAERERDAAAVKLREAEERLARFWQEWALRMQRLQLAPDTSVEEALARIDERARLLEQVEAQAKLRGRVEGMERDARAFEAEVRGLVSAHLPALADAELERAAEELVRAHHNARADAVQREGIDRELRSRRDELAEVEARAAAARAVFAEQLAAAHASDLQGLVLAEERSERARELDRKLADLHDRLREASDGEDLAALEHQLRDASMDSLRQHKAEVQEQLAQVDEEHAAAIRTLAATEAGLATLQGDEAAACAVEAEQHLDAIDELTRRYVRLRLAAELLALVIRRYRDEHQAPMVRHASALFSRLTLGRYLRLDVSYDERDEPALVCVDADERVVPVEALSDGARDQLYLALRLASIARFAERSEPLPLVLDDVLVQFDDERAAAGLKVLAEMAAVTQIVFFTHHARLVELAQRALPSDKLVVHQLDQSSTRSPTLGSTIAG